MKQITVNNKMAAKSLHEAVRNHLIARGINPTEYVKLYFRDGEVLVSDIPLNGHLEKIVEKVLPQGNYRIKEYDYSGN